MDRAEKRQSLIETVKKMEKKLSEMRAATESMEERLRLARGLIEEADFLYIPEEVKIGDGRFVWGRKDKA